MKSVFSWVVLFFSFMSHVVFAGEIHRAVVKNDIPRVNELVLADPKVLYERLPLESRYQTPLHLAVIHGLSEMTDVLLRLEAKILKDPEIVNQDTDTLAALADIEGYTPVDFANFEFSKLLMKVDQLSNEEKDEWSELFYLEQYSKILKSLLTVRPSINFLLIQNRPNLLHYYIRKALAKNDPAVLNEIKELVRAQPSYARSVDSAGDLPIDLVTEAIINEMNSQDRVDVLYFYDELWQLLPSPMGIYLERLTNEAAKTLHENELFRESTSLVKAVRYVRTNPAPASRNFYSSLQLLGKNFLGCKLTDKTSCEKTMNDILRGVANGLRYPPNDLRSFFSNLKKIMIEKFPGKDIQVSNRVLDVFFFRFLQPPLRLSKDKDCLLERKVLTSVLYNAVKYIPSTLNSQPALALPLENSVSASEPGHKSELSPKGEPSPKSESSVGSHPAVKKLNLPQKSSPLRGSSSPTSTTGSNISSPGSDLIHREPSPGPNTDSPKSNESSPRALLRNASARLKKLGHSSQNLRSPESQRLPLEVADFVDYYEQRSDAGKDIAAILSQIYALITRSDN